MSESQFITLTIGVVAYLISVKLIGAVFAAWKVRTYNKKRISLAAVFFFPGTTCLELMDLVDGKREFKFRGDHLILDNADDGVKTFYSFIWPLSLVTQLALLAIFGMVLCFGVALWLICVGIKKTYDYLNLQRVVDFIVRPVCG